MPNPTATIAIHFSEGFKDKDPKQVAEFLSEVAHKGGWENRRLADQFVKTEGFTKEIHDALMNHEKPGSIELLRSSRHLNDQDIIKSLS